MRGSQSSHFLLSNRSRHSECVKFVKKFNLPLLVTGGGGYTKENVARCWAVETGVLLDAELPNDGIKYFAPDYTLKIPNGCMLDAFLENLNSKSYLSTIKVQVLESLRCIQHAPRVQMQRSRRELNDPENALIGAFAGAITGAITTPLDVMKTRLMVQDAILNKITMLDTHLI
ncbi:histone deacetylase 9 isoform X4 [Canna indica]|uniref:Histone deacetylase 9 isoform X4 n=1 Tax=Canna indica TaxID=4628 RepID=A0AAQ3KYM5_9LILI|nr:histone deacetylase 9 isoform X4 [Canna indica]